jgi:diguanylate cyclase (GGDEF)-like protein
MRHAIPNLRIIHPAFRIVNRRGDLPAGEGPDRQRPQAIAGRFNNLKIPENCATFRPGEISMLDPFDETICDRNVNPAAVTPREAGGSIMLIIIAGSEADFGRHFILEKERVLLGRDEGSDIAIHDGRVSKAHCRLAVSRDSDGRDRIVLHDLDTTNGTYVNGEAITRTELQPGDKIQIGDTVLQLSYNDEIEREFHRKLFDLAVRDALTGMYNKRFVLNEMESHMRIARRNGRADIDDFKQINDRFGHPSGDEYLQHVAALFAQCLRDQDIAGRIGGEEFLFLLPETGIDGALQLAGRIRKIVEESVLDPGDRKIRTTISAGVCQFESRIGGMREFLDMADRALYEAKKAEKNKVMRALPLPAN